MAIRQLLGSGKFWMLFWMAAFAVMVLWGAATFLWWFDSVRNLNALSIVALWLACGAGFQGTLSMRKSDPSDPL